METVPLVWKIPPIVFVEDAREKGSAVRALVTIQQTLAGGSVESLDAEDKLA
jgi:hypothetical protein